MSNAEGWPYDSAASSTLILSVISTVGVWEMSDAGRWPYDSAAGPVSFFSWFILH